MKKTTRNNKVHQWTFFLGLALLALSYIGRYGAFGALRPMGLTTIFICPILGLVGLGFSIRNRSLVFGILNFIQIFSFFIVMWIGYHL